METRHCVQVILPDKSEIPLINVPLTCTTEQMLSRLFSHERVKKLNCELQIVQNGKVLNLEDVITESTITLEKIEYTTKQSVSIFYFIIILLNIIVPTFLYNFAKVSRIATLLSIAIGLFLYALATVFVTPQRNMGKGIKSSIIIDLIVLYLKSSLPTFRLEQLVIHE